MKKILLTITLACLATPVQSGVTSWWKGRRFSTLGDLKSRANALTEYPKMDNKDYLKPNYTSFYGSLNSGFFKRTWSKMKTWWPYYKSTGWSPKILKKLLKSTVEKRKLGANNKDYLKITPRSGSKIAIWTSLHGAYHSLVRELEELKKRDVIDNNLNIKNKKYYFVFNGNAIDFSPFSMETLTTILLLMKKNPENVFYVRGPHESQDFWMRHGLRQELQGKIKKTKHFVLLERLIDQFFDTLPKALYLGKKTGVLTQFVQVSNGNTLYKSGKDPKIPVDLCLGSENGFYSLSGLKGLKKKTGEKGVPIWTLFSGQNRTHRAMREFFHDSFVVLSLNDIFSRSTLSLYSRDTTKKDDNFIKTTYLAFSKAMLPTSSRVR